ncbi:hypothetical protein K3G39_06905 [Pontibacter sp. HSC-14F20]|uniref:hypothetical protein n=1 Tax=Pontibacter sp. HSC-14F20 TaxID=2864136 RepID=UPI001C72CD63|nr:hypothetical protein [Pontibacter sp. HSC-14F20]MBX0332962.1 hypothetical protein [Pontibacter sp. HSC-14F20]
MNHYLAPVLRQQFNLYYRFGYTFIPNALLIPFDGVVGQTQVNEVLKFLLQVTPFEYDEEYVILHVQSEGEAIGGNIKFDIQQLTSVYPLSQQAKASIAQKIDQRITLGNPLFESSLAKVEDTIQKEETIKGIEALWSIFLENDTEKDKYITLLDLDCILNALSLRSKGRKPSDLKDESYLAYLLTYERYGYFPKEGIGYFYDAGQIFAHSINKPFEGGKLHSLLNQIYKERSTAGFDKVVSKIENEPLAAPYKSMNTVDGIRQYVLTPLFLLLKDHIRNADSFSAVKDSNFFTHARENFNAEFKAAIILLGAFFKFKAFYDEYYNIVNLDIYQAQPLLPPVIKESIKQTQVEAITATEQETENQTTTETSEQLEPSEKLSATEAPDVQHLQIESTEVLSVEEPTSDVVPDPLQSEASTDSIDSRVTFEANITDEATPEIVSQSEEAKSDISEIREKETDGAKDAETQLGFSFISKEQDSPSNSSISNVELTTNDAVPSNSTDPIQEEGNNERIEPIAEPDIKKPKKLRAKSTKSKKKLKAEVTLLTSDTKDDNGVTPGETVDLTIEKDTKATSVKE